jgi:hypothetical protein
MFFFPLRRRGQLVRGVHRVLGELDDNFLSVRIGPVVPGLVRVRHIENVRLGSRKLGIGNNRYLIWKGQNTLVSNLFIQLPYQTESEVRVRNCNVAVKEILLHCCRERDRKILSLFLVSQSHASY